MAHPEVLIDWIGGNCPVQAQGTVDGYPFYFRARGESWTIAIANGTCKDPVDVYCGLHGEDGWRYSEDYGDTQFAAGWMSEEEAIAFIHKAVDEFRKEQYG